MIICTFLFVLFFPCSLPHTIRERIDSGVKEVIFFMDEFIRYISWSALCAPLSCTQWCYIFGKSIVLRASWKRCLFRVVPNYLVGAGLPHLWWRVVEGLLHPCFSVHFIFQGSPRCLTLQMGTSCVVGSVICFLCIYSRFIGWGAEIWDVWSRRHLWHLQL